MKHIKILILLIIVLQAACKYDETSYSFVREYDGGTYLTNQGASKYISGRPDTVTLMRDVYGRVEQTVTYVNHSQDSILIYGHVWGLSPSSKITDSTATFFMIDPDQDGKPNEHIKSDTLQSGQTFESVMINLIPERLYYIRSYVITGDIENPEKRDTAYNPITTEKMTAAPQDEWEIREPFDGNPGNGAISFTYKNELYIGLAHNEYETDRGIYKYTPASNTWTQVTTWPGPSPPSNAVAFVITNVKENVGVYKDYVYIGTGFIVDGNDTVPSKQFYRYNLTNNNWVSLDAQSEFTGLRRQNAIAFTIGNKGYVGLGTGPDNVILRDLYQFDPTLTDSNHPYGEWTPMKNFTPGPRTKAATFTIGNTAFVCGGMDANGTLYNDLWIYRQTADGNGAWTQRASFPSTPRAGACGFTIEEFGYMGTGQDADSLCSDFWRYNPFVNAWERRADFSGGPRVNAVGAGIKYGENDFRGYMGLGRGETNTTYFNDFWQYRP